MNSPAGLCQVTCLSAPSLKYRANNSSAGYKDCTCKQVQNSHSCACWNNTSYRNLEPGPFSPHQPLWNSDISYWWRKAVLMFHILEKEEMGGKEEGQRNIGVVCSSHVLGGMVSNPHPIAYLMCVCALLLPLPSCRYGAAISCLCEKSWAILFVRHMRR